MRMPDVCSDCGAEPRGGRARGASCACGGFFLPLPGPKALKWDRSLGRWHGRVNARRTLDRRRRFFLRLNGSGAAS